MVKLTNKEHEIQQLNRIKKLENDMNQQKSRIDKLEKRIVVLEVWERKVTSIDNGSIKEQALGGPDTSIRTKNKRLRKTKSQK